MSTLQITLAALVLGLTAGAAEAQSTPDGDARFLFESRVRSETIDQDGRPQQAHAATVRARLGWRSPTAGGLQALVEGEGVAVLDDSYSAPLAPSPSRPSVADGETLELNRAQLRWSGRASTEIIAGRQRLIVGNGRFVGNSGWRQNEQTFDAVRVSTQVLQPVSVTWVFANRVRRPLGPEHPQGVWRGDIHLLEVEGATPAGRLSVFGLTSDLDNAVAQSATTIGARLTGSRPMTGALSLTWAGEYAQQRDAGANPLDFALDFQSAVIGLQTSGWSASIGVDRFEGDGVSAFQTPLGSGHGFLGWSDVISATPSVGVRDLFLRGQVNAPVFDKSVRLTAEAHAFQDDGGALDLGRELDLSAVLPIGGHWSAELKAAHFVSDHPMFKDTDKGWLILEYRY